MPYQLGLPAALLRFGLTVELYPGWETRGSSSFNPGGAVSHWTAGPRGTSGRPSLGLVVVGRSDLVGPLCNTYLDRQGRVVVVAAGRANHAGPGGWGGLVGNSAVFGTEAECGGDGDWTDAQRWAYPRVNAAYCWLMGRSASWVCGHNEWAPTRKIDIRDWPMAEMRAQVAAILAGGGEVDDMFDAAAESRLMARFDQITGEAVAARQAAQEAAAASALSATRAAAATTQAAQATAVARAALDTAAAGLDLGRLSRHEQHAARAVLEGRLVDLRLRLPRVNTARYDRPGVTSYQALADRAADLGLTYLDASGQLAGVQASAAVDDDAAQSIAQQVAARVAAPTSGTWSTS